MIKNASIFFDKKCPKTICLAMIEYMEKGMSEEKAYKRMIVDLRDQKYPHLEDI